MGSGPPALVAFLLGSAHAIAAPAPLQPDGAASADRPTQGLADYPANRHGLAVMPYGGMQFRILGSDFFSTGYRFGLMIGGFLNDHFSFSGEGALAAWNRDSVNCISPQYGPCESPRAHEFDINATLMRHAYWSRLGLIVGPRIGVSYLRGDGSNFTAQVAQVTPQVGARVGLLASPVRWVSLGVLADVAALFAADDLNAVGSVAAAALF